MSLPVGGLAGSLLTAAEVAVAAKARIAEAGRVANSFIFWDNRLLVWGEIVAAYHHCSLFMAVSLIVLPLEQAPLCGRCYNAVRKVMTAA